MKTMKRFLSMAALALAGAIITACSGSDDGIDTPPQPENTGKVVTLKTTVGFDDGGATTRALTANGVKTFAAGETMALRYANQSDKRTVKESEPLQADDIAADGKSATFTFILTEEPNKNSSVKYIYPAAMAKADGNENYDALFTEQDGTLAKLASNFDVATANDKPWDGDNLPSATLENQLAILAITLKDDVSGANITSSITGLTITARDAIYFNSITYNITRSAAPGPIYVAIFSTKDLEFDVTATGGAYTYTKTLTDRNYIAGNGYNVSWRMTDVTPPNAVPLTVEALTDGTIVVDKPREGMQYSKNSGAKTAVTSDAIDVEAGDKVQFYGTSTDVQTYNSGSSDFTSITGSGDGFKCKVYGNIMSLVNETGFADATTLTADNTFQRLFYNNTKLTNASGLLLPATTLAQGCYAGMFSGCSGLTDAPALPATTLADNCYREMFSRCTSLTTAPALPATELANSCYNGMFFGCTSLTDAPVLPAETLAQGQSCYSSMFSGCTSLTTAPALPATTLAPNCYFAMFDGCTSLTDAPALPATKLAQGCYQLMFRECTKLTAAPALPATTLAKYCYQYMFVGCTKLNAVTCLATNISADDCSTYWLSDVAASGTFTTPYTTHWLSGANGIPSGWTRVNPDGIPYGQ